MRSKAVHRAMEKIIDDEGLEQSAFLGRHDAFAEKLWRATRCMSEEEFLGAAEERGCGGVGTEGSACRTQKKGMPRQCGYAGCAVLWSDVTAKGNPRVAMGECCSALCEQHMRAHASRLGSRVDATARFNGLYELAKRERDGKLTATGTTNGRQDRGRSSKNSHETLAAGTKKTPIMHAVVKERDVSHAEAKKTKAVAFDAETVDGYRLKKKNEHSKDSKRSTNVSKRVHFPPDEALEQKQEFHSHDPAADVRGGGGHRAGSVQPHQPATTSVDSEAQFVFNIEDPKGPDDDMKSLGDMFGTLNVVRPDDGDDNEQEREQGHEQTTNTNTHTNNTKKKVNGRAPAEHIDAILAQTLRDGAKHFPHLTIPEDLLAQLEDQLSEHPSSPPTINSDTDITDIDSDFFSTDSDEDVPISCQKTFFTQLFTFFDYWITDASRSFVNTPYGENSTPPTHPIPQVPEVVTAIQRFITIATKTLAATICTATDPPPSAPASSSPSSCSVSPDAGTVIDRIARLVATFRLDAALPAFDSKQWIVVCLVMLKALGATNTVEFRTLTETTHGKENVGKLLGDALFTGEELLAVVSLFFEEKDHHGQEYGN